MNVMQKAERDLNDAKQAHQAAQAAEGGARSQRELISKQFATSVALKKVEAAAKHLAHCQFVASEADMDIERWQRERERR